MLHLRQETWLKIALDRAFDPDYRMAFLIQEYCKSEHESSVVALPEILFRVEWYSLKTWF